MIAAADAIAVPETVALQAPYGASNPPAGTAIENCTDVPVRVPLTVPRPVAPVSVSVITSEPENDAPDCVNCQVIWPGPDESLAVPVHVPATSAVVGDGVVGPDEDESLEHAATAKQVTDAARTMKRRAENTPRENRMDERDRTIRGSRHRGRALPLPYFDNRLLRDRRSSS